MHTLLLACVRYAGNNAACRRGLPRKAPWPRFIDIRNLLSGVHGACPARIPAWIRFRPIHAADLPAVDRHGELGREARTDACRGGCQLVHAGLLHHRLHALAVGLLTPAGTITRAVVGCDR